MATLLLSAAGSAIGGALGGSFLGLGAAGLGQAVGAVAGGVLDQRLLGSGSRTVHSGRARSLRIQAATDGAPLPRVYGRMRVTGQIIWSTRFLETVRKGGGGGKGGGPEIREYSYSISVAIALAEGPIDRVGRIWADGKLLDTADLAMRVYHGDDAQLPDPKIEAVEGAGGVPAFRGTAYIVLEDLPVGPFGNRIPQISAEVFRNVERPPETDPEAGIGLRHLIKGVAMSPGTGEFALDPEPARHVFGDGTAAYANINNSSGTPDFVQSLDHLGAELPETKAISFIVSWFGDDLRAGECTVRPKIEVPGRETAPEPWRVSGLTTATALPVSRDEGDRPRFGGTPSDGSVIRAIREMRDRGYAVMLYPFLLMDIAPGNALPNPYGGASQPPFPWRGRITLGAAPGQPGSADQTAAARGEVAAFFGAAKASDFSVTEGGVTYSGPEEWGWRRCALHMAALAKAAGGVEAFCIGSEFRELTTIRSAKTAYPAVDELIALAAEVRALLPEAMISYAADWSEYFGHQPADGSGDRIFHLDPLWADANIDFVEIDDYLPLSDWRHTANHLDRAAGARSVYSLAYLQSNVEGGEHYDWYYATEDDRVAQIRTPIEDTAHGEHWVFRPKDIRNWWANPHHNRIDGVRQETPTAWVPQSKPVWLTETGAPSVDLGANKPNLFFDPKSSESGLPPGSLGARDDEIQRRFLQAKLGYWRENAPISSVYQGLMIPGDRIFVWTWDARPFPDFPVRESVWSDGPQYQLGHWLTGRITSSALADIVWHINLTAGVTQVDVSLLFGAVPGFILEETGTPRQALQPLMLAYGFDGFESAGALHYVLRSAAEEKQLDPDWLAEMPEALDDLVRERASEGENPDAVRLSFIQAESDYRIGAAQAWVPGGNLRRVNESSVPIALSAPQAQATVERWLSDGLAAQDRVQFALPPSEADLVPGDVVLLPGPGRMERYRIERLTQDAAREAEAVWIDEGYFTPAVAALDSAPEPELPAVPGPVSALILDLPIADGGAEDHWPHLAASASPWPGEVSVYRSPQEADFSLVASLRAPAFVGTLLSPLAPGMPGLWQRASVDVALPSAALQTADRLSVLNGANALAVEAAAGAWEILQAQSAELTAPGVFRLAGFLRGQRGTEALAGQTIAAGARVVVLDLGVPRTPLPLEVRGLPRHWRVGPAAKPVSDASYTAIEAVVEGQGLRPLAPAHLTARRDPQSGDVSIGWIRRTRVGGDSWEGADVPLGEEREAYRLRIFSGGGLLRQAEVAAPAFTYSAAEQAADGAAGALTIRVAQLSTAYGYGWEKEIVFDG